MTAGARPIPRATYRLQLNKDFTFRDVAGIAGYLGELGISHAYLSPILKARPGSTHGYDTVDHTVLNPELGTLDDFRAMAETLREAGVSIILDIVPNHMGIGGDENPLWLDVLEWGRESRYADWFDINWEPSEPTLHNKVLVPFLGSSYGEALRDGKLELRYDRAQGSFAIWAESAHKLPVCPRAYGRILGRGSEALVAMGAAFDGIGDRSDAALQQDHLLTCYNSRADVAETLESRVAQLNSEPGRAALADLIEIQHWRPARASVAADDINYRRFFIVSDLAAIRVERDDVFEHVHALTFQLVEEGLVEGLRVDHIDGLHDPEAYCRTLRARCPRPIYLVVEKILAPHEALRANWDVEGTTGYEFSGAVTRLLTDPDGEAPLTEFYEEFTGWTHRLDDVERRAKLGIIDFEMAAELDSLTSRLRKIAACDRLTADITRNALRNALRATVASLPVYRTYVDGGPPNHIDRRTIGFAIASARKATPSLDPAVFDFLERVMTGEAGPDAPEAAMRIQQYTGPVMAKGLEDTALYRFNRLIALSDVGEKPDRYTQSIAAFHDFMKSRAERQPHGMLSSSSHDTKRGEDVRARLAAISGHTGQWKVAVKEWSHLLCPYAADIEPNDIYHFFQLLVGAWPAEWGPDVDLTAAMLEPFRHRVERTMLKSVREARLRTNWAVPRTDYEERVAQYVRNAVALQDPGFLASFRRFENTLAADGAANGLIATVLKLTVPGVPDIYQGAELWEQSMVDPDNRRPVDFSRRREVLMGANGSPAGDLMTAFRTGAIKLSVIRKLLALRSEMPLLFSHGTYEPMAIEGKDAERVLCFARRYGGDSLIVAAALGPWLGPPSAHLSGSLPGSWHDVIEGKPTSLDGNFGQLLGRSLSIAVFASNRPG